MIGGRYIIVFGMFPNILLIVGNELALSATICVQRLSRIISIIASLTQSVLRAGSIRGPWISLIG